MRLMCELEIVPRPAALGLMEPLKDWSNLIFAMLNR